MRRTEVLEGVRKMRFRSVYARYGQGELGQVEAAELLGVSRPTLYDLIERLGIRAT